jgi:hypothetical protein
MRRLLRICIAAALMVPPLGARGADLVVWWDKGHYAQEDVVVREVIAACEGKTGKQVEFTLHPMEKLPDDILI